MQRERSFVGDRFRGCQFSFRTEVVRDIRCSGRAHFSYLNEALYLQHIGLVGHNGVGKTALTHLLTGEAESSGGRQPN